MNRRDFIEKSFLASLGTLILSACTSSEKKDGPKQEKEPVSTPEAQQTPVTTASPEAGSPTPSETVKYVDANSIMAKNLKYVENVKNADKTLRVKRGDTEGKDQFCSNCSFYTPEPGKTYGRCTLLPDGFVPQTAWCNTWAKKVKAS